ncbi:MAG: VOC family protein [Armatimonadetes bacterium]|nr:VOC family protein [Armatimonadota bacterium]
MPRPVHFELPADDPERAVRFYEQAFGWKFQKWGGPMEYWMVVTGDDSEPGINGGMFRRGGPAEKLSNVLSVPDLDASVTAVTEAGGSVNMARHGIPGVGWFASVNDTEGNMIGLMQFDPTAG